MNRSFSISHRDVPQFLQHFSHKYSTIRHYIEDGITNLVHFEKEYAQLFQPTQHLLSQPSFNQIIPRSDYNVYIQNALQSLFNTSHMIKTQTSHFFSESPLTIPIKTFYNESMAILKAIDDHIDESKEQLQYAMEILNRRKLDVLDKLLTLFRIINTQLNFSSSSTATATTTTTTTLNNNIEINNALQHYKSSLSSYLSWLGQTRKLKTILFLDKNHILQLEQIETKRIHYTMLILRTYHALLTQYHMEIQSNLYSLGQFIQRSKQTVIMNQLIQTWRNQFGPPPKSTIIDIPIGLPFDSNTIAIRNSLSNTHNDNTSTTITHISQPTSIIPNQSSSIISASPQYINPNESHKRGVPIGLPIQFIPTLYSQHIPSSQNNNNKPLSTSQSPILIPNKPNTVHITTNNTSISAQSDEIFLNFLHSYINTNNLHVQSIDDFDHYLNSLPPPSLLTLSTTTNNNSSQLPQLNPHINLPSQHLHPQLNNQSLILDHTNSFSHTIPNFPLMSDFFIFAQNHFEIFYITAIIRRFGNFNILGITTMTQIYILCYLLWLVCKPCSHQFITEIQQDKIEMIIEKYYISKFKSNFNSNHNDDDGDNNNQKIIPTVETNNNKTNSLSNNNSASSLTPLHSQVHSSFLLFGGIALFPHQYHTVCVMCHNCTKFNYRDMEEYDSEDILKQFQPYDINQEINNNNNNNNNNISNNTNNTNNNNNVDPKCNLFDTYNCDLIPLFGLISPNNPNGTQFPSNEKSIDTITPQLPTQQQQFAFIQSLYNTTTDDEKKLINSIYSGDYQSHCEDNEFQMWKCKLNIDLKRAKDIERNTIKQQIYNNSQQQFNNNIHSNGIQSQMNLISTSPTTNPPHSTHITTSLLIPTNSTTSTPLSSSTSVNNNFTLQFTPTTTTQSTPSQPSFDSKPTYLQQSSVISIDLADYSSTNYNFTPINDKFSTPLSMIPNVSFTQFSQQNPSIFTPTITKPVLHPIVSTSINGIQSNNDALLKQLIPESNKNQSTTNSLCFPSPSVISNQFNNFITNLNNINTNDNSLNINTTESNNLNFDTSNIDLGGLGLLDNPWLNMISSQPSQDNNNNNQSTLFNNNITAAPTTSIQQSFSPSNININPSNTKFNNESSLNKSKFAATPNSVINFNQVPDLPTTIQQDQQQSQSKSQLQSDINPSLIQNSPRTSHSSIFSPFFQPSLPPIIPSVLQNRLDITSLTQTPSIQSQQHDDIRSTQVSTPQLQSIPSFDKSSHFTKFTPVVHESQSSTSIIPLSSTLHISPKLTTQICLFESNDIITPQNNDSKQQIVTLNDNLDIDISAKHPTTHTPLPVVVESPIYHQHQHFDLNTSIQSNDDKNGINLHIDPINNLLPIPTTLLSTPPRTTPIELSPSLKQTLSQRFKHYSPILTPITPSTTTTTTTTTTIPPTIHSKPQITFTMNQSQDTQLLQTNNMNNHLTIVNDTKDIDQSVQNIDYQQFHTPIQSKTPFYREYRAKSLPSPNITLFPPKLASESSNPSPPNVSITNTVNKNVVQSNNNNIDVSFHNEINNELLLYSNEQTSQLLISTAQLTELDEKFQTTQHQLSSEIDIEQLKYQSTLPATTILLTSENNDDNRTNFDSNEMNDFQSFLSNISDPTQPQSIQQQPLQLQQQQQQLKQQNISNPIYNPQPSINSSTFASITSQQSIQPNQQLIQSTVPISIGPQFITARISVLLSECQHLSSLLIPPPSSLPITTQPSTNTSSILHFQSLLQQLQSYLPININSHTQQQQQQQQDQHQSSSNQQHFLATPTSHPIHFQHLSPPSIYPSSQISKSSLSLPIQITSQETLTNITSSVLRQQLVDFQQNSPNNQINTNNNNNHNQHINTDQSTPLQSFTSNSIENHESNQYHQQSSIQQSDCSNISHNPIEKRLKRRDLKRFLTKSKFTQRRRNDSKQYHMKSSLISTNESQMNKNVQMNKNTQMNKNGLQSDHLTSTIPSSITQPLNMIKIKTTNQQQLTNLDHNQSYLYSITSSHNTPHHRTSSNNINIQDYDDEHSQFRESILCESINPSLLTSDGDDYLDFVFQRIHTPIILDNPFITNQQFNNEQIVAKRPLSSTSSSFLQMNQIITPLNDPSSTTDSLSFTLSDHNNNPNISHFTPIMNNNTENTQDVTNPINTHNSTVNCINNISNSTYHSTSQSLLQSTQLPLHQSVLTNSIPISTALSIHSFEENSLSQCPTVQIQKLNEFNTIECESITNNTIMTDTNRHNSFHLIQQLPAQIQQLNQQSDLISHITTPITTILFHSQSDPYIPTQLNSIIQHNNNNNYNTTLTNQSSTPTTDQHANLLQPRQLHNSTSLSSITPISTVMTSTVPLLTINEKNDPDKPVLTSIFSTNEQNKLDSNTLINNQSINPDYSQYSSQSISPFHSHSSDSSFPSPLSNVFYDNHSIANIYTNFQTNHLEQSSSASNTSDSNSLHPKSSIPVMIRYKYSKTIALSWDIDNNDIL